MLALTPTLEVIKQAKENSCNLIITHHPLFMDGIKSIDIEKNSSKLIVESIKNEISIYSSHTSLDVAEGGTGDVLAEELGVRNIKTLDSFLKIGEVDETEIDFFIQKVKKALNINNLRVINANKVKKVKNVGVCAGSGGDFIPHMKDIDIFITGDIKYHQALEAVDFAVLDAGHFESEIIILDKISEILSEFELEIIKADEKSPFEII